MGLYQSLVKAAGNTGIPEGPALCGFDLGNRVVAGCLSGNESSRIHSCEPGVACPAVRNSKAVYITPIVNRTKDGTEIREVGAGGGIGDLYQIHELELPDQSTLAELGNLCLKHISDKDRLIQMHNVLSEAFRSRKKALSLDQYGVKEEGDISLQKLVEMLGRGLSDGAKPDLTKTIVSRDHSLGEPISYQIQRFPYSRHSSYSELCELVAAFRPKDIHPCTVDPSSWNEDVSIQRLFGHLCSGRDFAHDAYMRETLEDTDDEGNQRARKRARYDENLSTQSTQDSSVAEGGHATLSLEGDEYLEPQDQISRLPMPAVESQKSFDGQSTHSSSSQTLSPQTNQAKFKNTNRPADVDQTKVKRDEVRKAHQYLQEHADPRLIHIGSLPPWPAEEETSQTSEESTRAPTHQSSNEIPQYFNANNSKDEPPSLQIHPPQNQDSQLTETTSLSIPESALVISPPPRNEHTTRTTSDQNHEHEQEHDANGTHSMRNRITARTRARIAAYLAAREDSWMDVSLISAGNNHAEEEMEL